MDRIGLGVCLMANLGVCAGLSFDERVYADGACASDVTAVWYGEPSLAGVADEVCRRYEPAQGPPFLF